MENSNIVNIVFDTHRVIIQYRRIAISNIYLVIFTYFPNFTAMLSATKSS